MTPIQLGVVLSLKDRASQALGVFSEKLRTAKDAGEDLVNSIQTGGQLILSGMGMAYSGTKLLTGALSGPLYAAASLETEMARVGTIAGASAGVMRELQTEVGELAVRYSKSQEEMARGLYGTISAGITDAREAVKALDVAAKMAAAGVTETDTAISGLTSVLNAYHLSAKESINVSDAMFMAMKRGKTTMDALAGSMGAWTGNAAALGVTYQDALSAIAAATLPGMSTQSASQGMRSLLDAYVKPQKAAIEEARQYGVELSAAAIKTKGLYGVLTEVNKLPADVISRIFLNTRTATFVRNVMSGGGEAFSSITAEMQSAAGATDEAFAKVAATFNFRLGYMNSALMNFIKLLGMPLLGPAGRVVEVFGRMFQWLGALPAPVYAIISGLTSFAGVALLAVGTLAALAGATQLWGHATALAQEQIIAMKAQAVGLKGAIAGIMSPLGAFIAAAGLAYLAWKNNWGGIRDTVEGVTAGIKMAMAANEDGIATVEKSVADRLKKLGVWEFAVTMGRAFYRVRRFGESFVAGVRTWVGWLMTFGKTVANSTRYIWSPIISAATKVLDVFGLLKNVGADSASQFGDSLGKLAAAFATCYVAVKSWKIGVEVANTALWPLNKAINILRNEHVKSAAAWAASKAAMLAHAAVTKAVTAAQWALNAAMHANPIVLVIGAAIALAVILYKKWGAFRNFVDNILAAIKNKGAQVCNFLASRWNGFVEWFKSIPGRMAEWFKTIPDRIMEWFKTIPDRIMEALSNLKGRLSAWFSELWESVKPDFASWFGIDKKHPVNDYRAGETWAEFAARHPELYANKTLSVPANAAQTAQAAAEKATQVPTERVIDTPRVQTDTSATLANRPANLGAQAQAQTWAAAESQQEQKPVRVESVTTVTPSKVYVNLDGREIGEAAVEYMAVQHMLSGGSE